MKKNVVVIILWTVFVLSVLLSPISEIDISILWGFEHSDKVAHFCLFAITGFISVFSTKFIGQFKSRIFFGIAFGLILALATEFAQSFIPFRYMSFYDLLFDIAGIGVGLTFYVFLYSRYRIRTLLRL